MSVKEKLVELVGKARRYAANKCHSFMSCAECDHCGEHDGNCRNTYIAESLIADGVTVQEWISVEERLPENSTYVNAVTDGVVAQAYWHNGKFFAFTAIGVATIGGASHWMPLPEPPCADMKGAAHDS